MDERSPSERRLDDLLRPVLVVDPPPVEQQSILAAVLAAAPVPTAAARRTVIAAPAASARTVSPAAYLLLGAALLAYVGLISWFQGIVGGADWLTTMTRQVLAAVDLVTGQPVSADPLALVANVFQFAPWLALLPVAFLLWERDRAPTRTT